MPLASQQVKINISLMLKCTLGHSMNTKDNLDLGLMIKRDNMVEKVVFLLDEIQRTMEQAGLWQPVSPSPEKMSSLEPFSLDTLSFLEWLQWVYIARLRAIVDAEMALPSGAKVHPYAEEALKSEAIQSPVLLALIQELDDLLL